MDVGKFLGGLCVYYDSSVRFGLTAKCSEELRIEDQDFTARFDGIRWIVRWNWANDEPRLSNHVASYKIDKNIRADFDAEIYEWIKEEILVPVPDSDEVQSVIPLMAVCQVNKQKIRPVLDFKQLNRYVSCHSGNSAVCDDTIRRWRKTGHNVSLLDLRKAYLQLYVDQRMWKHQLVRYKSRHYYLTRLGFGVNSAPKIMSRILEKVLSMQEKICAGTSNYLDDILVNEQVVTVDEVKQHLLRFGLRVKPSLDLRTRARVLGLQVEKSANGELMWKRAGNIPPIPAIDDRLTRRELFSICGQIVGHYPVANWLRVACGYVKRISDGTRRDDDVGQNAKVLLREMMFQLQKDDPVKGVWYVKSNRGKVWCDASSLAVACSLEIDGDVVEDGAWLRKEDSNHINMALLDSVLKGLNMAAKWRIQELEIMTDSATVAGWLRSALFDSHTVRTHGMNEILVKRRLSVVRDICKEYSIQPTVTWVESRKNKADALTRVSSKWLRSQAPETTLSCVAVSEKEDEYIRNIHEQHHFGINRTLYLSKLKFPSITKDNVARILETCIPCRSIDPAPIRWRTGNLDVDGNWYRIAVDVTHYNRACYLTVIDCGPGRFAIWRRMPDESVSSILVEIIQIFRERGPPKEILMDNGASFRSMAMKNTLKEWSVEPCAYRPEGNAIIERHHRTTKSARSHRDPLQIVYWYNVTPRDAANPESLPSQALHTYNWRIPEVCSTESDGQANEEL